jgi:hypothetical protein
MRFQVLTVVSMKMTVFWVVVTCSLVEVYWCFRGSRHLWNSINFHQTTWHSIPEGSHLYSDWGAISGSHGGEYEDNCLLGCCLLSNYMTQHPRRHSYLSWLRFFSFSSHKCQDSTLKYATAALAHSHLNSSFIIVIPYLICCYTKWSVDTASQNNLMTNLLIILSAEMWQFIIQLPN